MMWLWILLAFIAGGIFGVSVMCLMFAAKGADRHIEELNNSEKGG